MAVFENWGDYFWPGQIDECRRNLLGIRDAAELEKRERSRTAARAAQLVSGQAEVPATFDLDHLRGIHRHLFQDVYEWAGDLRVTELVRPSTDPNMPGNEFVKPGDIERLAGVVFGQLGDPTTLAGRARGEQLEVLASTYAGINVLHPFVEGNGRTQRLFLSEVAQAAGLHIDWSKMPDQNQVMAEAFTAGYRPVLEALEPCVTLRGSDEATGRSEPAADRISRIRQAMNPPRGNVPTHGPGTFPSARPAPGQGRQQGRGPRDDGRH